MAAIGLAELLVELETSPNETELIDVEQLLREAGYLRKDRDDGLVLFVHEKWGSRWTLNRLQRYLPVSLVNRITTTIRECAAKEGRL
jgi:hypothetical protein